MPNYTSIDQLPPHHREQAAAEIERQERERPLRGPGRRAVTVEEIDARPKRPHKYNAKKMEIDGVTFDSRKEAQRYLQLKQMAAAGEIHALQLQPRFELQPSFKDASGKTIRAIHYVADFQYVEGGRVIVEDVKGMETAVFKLKRKLFLFTYPDVELRIV
jgi:hypothetical protein